MPCISFAILEFAMNITLDQLATAMDNHLREMNALLQQHVQRLDRRLQRATLAYATLEAQRDEFGGELQLVSRILHDVFIDYPAIRESYRHIFEFADLPEFDDEPEDEPIENVQRRLDFGDLSDIDYDSDLVEVIDLTMEE